MALSKVQNLASILCNNALAGGKIDNGFNMFEAPPSNCSTDNRHRDYDPWSYDLLGRNSNNQATLDEEEAQDLNNSMVNDLVAKILDDDPIITEETYGHRYNGNPRYNETQSSRMLKGRSATLSSYQDDIGMSQIGNPYKLPSMTANQEENNREFVNMYSALNSMTLNDCIAQTLEKSNDYGNVTSPNCQRTVLTDLQQRARLGDDGTSVPMVNYAVSNGHLRNGHNYGSVQSSNWSENCSTHDYAKDMFGNYQNVQNSNHDLNFNTIALAEMDLRRGMGNNHHQHHNQHHQYGNQTLNIPDSYNNLTTANSQNYRVSSSMSDMSMDSMFTANSAIQHFSPSESTLQNCLSTNYARNYEDYKDAHEGMSTSMMHGDSPYLQQNNYKVDRQMDQSYKALVNRFRSLNEFNLPASEVCQSEPVTVNQNRIDGSLLKVLSPRSKSHEAHNQSSKLRAYPRNMTPRQSEQPTSKSNYHVHNGYQHYTASNSDNFKAMPQNFPTPLKRSNTQCSYKIDPYDLSDVPFNGNAHLAQQIARASMENNVFNQIMKQRHQQIQRMSSVPGAGVLLNARLMRPGNPQGTVFPSVMPLVQVPVPPINPMSVLFNRLNMRNGARSTRRGGPSSVLHLKLEQTFEQFKLLEKERKKCEAALADHFPGKRVSSVNNIPTPRLQGNASRADRLIVDHFQEHARVITLIAKMEHLRGATMSKQIHKAMENWLESIKYVQECRKKEIEYTNMRRNENLECMPINDDKRVLALAGSIHQLAKASRLARAGMFNALQATLLHNKEIERRIIENSEDPIVTAKEAAEQSTNGEIGQFTEST